MNYVIYIVALFSTVGFFNYHGVLTDAASRGIFYAISAMALVMAVTERKSSLSDIDYPRGTYRLLMVMICLSPLMANIFHRQPLKESVISTLPPIFSYAFFYILLKFRIPPEKIIKVIFVACALSIPVYFANVTTFPSVMFGLPVEEDLSRGILRIYVVFIELFVLLLFYSINRWNLERRPKWIVCIVILGLMIVLSVIRQIIAMSAILGLILLLKHWSWPKKIAGIAVVIGAAMLILPHIPIYQDLTELTVELQEKNESKNEEDIRIQAWRFYTYEYQQSPLTMIFGNGIPAMGKTAYGRQYASDTDATKCYEADVGWAGFFFDFGIIATAALFVLLWKAARRKKAPEDEYLTYWIIFIMVTAVASGPILYYYQVFNLSTVLYLVYCRKA